ncbi:MAG: CoA transferase [Deltaproteobacteria bacterium]|nr:CoA transferase [Deltaproteobacteria bacterium]
MSKSALSGIKVVELATMYSGPYCGKLLADLGADVIKVEPPVGDPARFEGAFPTEEPHPEKSVLFLYLNTSKRGVTFDLNKTADLEQFKKLLGWADVLIDNHRPDYLPSLGLDWQTIRKLYPRLIYTSITPYGCVGPRALQEAGEMTIVHAAGLGNLLPAKAVDISRPPVKTGGNTAQYIAGIYAALSTAASLIGRRKTGLGNFIDISIQDVIMNLIAPRITMNRYQFTSWGRVPDRPQAMGRMETSDGYIVLAANDDHHFRAVRELVGNPDWAQNDGWNDRGWRLNHLMDVAPQMEAWMREQKKFELYHRAAKMKIPIGTINTAKDVMESEQYKSRGFFIDVDHPVAGKYPYAGWSYKMPASPPRVSRPSPLLGQHNEEVFSEIAKIEPVDVKPLSQKDLANPENFVHPLKGIRILDFSWVWAGPYCNLLLGALGAEVIKIEGHNRLDLSRRNYPWPLPNPAPIKTPPNQGMSFNSVNMNKKSATIDLSKPEGLALTRKLVAVSNVVIDNMRAGAMIKLGLGYEDLRRIRPDIIAMTIASRGMTGPERDYLGYANIHHAIGGAAYLTGFPDDHPSHGAGGDTDIFDATTAAFAVVAALHHHAQTGEGQFIDLSQCEGVSSLIGEYLLEYAMTGKIPERIGNAHPRYAPHAVYRCWGVDRWLALEIRSDDEFAKLARIIGRPELVTNRRFKTMAARKRNEKALDKFIEDWTKERDRDWMVKEFCEAGLIAAPSREGRDLYADEHLRVRGSFVKIDHPELGELEMVRVPWRMNDQLAPMTAAPQLAKHNPYVFGEILELSNEEINELRDKKVIM